MSLLKFGGELTANHSHMHTWQRQLVKRGKISVIVVRGKTQAYDDSPQRNTTTAHHLGMYGLPHPPTAHHKHKPDNKPAIA